MEMENVIKTALPSANEAVIQKLEERLIEIGIESLEDFQFIENENVSDILKPIQAKKFLQFCKEVIPKSSIVTISEVSDYTCTENVNVEEEAQFAPKIIEASGLASWADSFQINWELFPRTLVEAAQKKELPKKKDVNEMIRIVVTQILNIEKNPGRKNLRTVALKIVSQYPESFQDSYGSSVLSNGCTTIMKKLENCIENRKRNLPVLEKNFGVEKKKRKTTRESYGCVNWQPTDLQENESRETQTEHREWLLNEYKKMLRNEEDVTILMKTTYPSQRFFINNSKTSISSVMEQWPFLCEEKHHLNHASELLGCDILDIMTNSLHVKGKKIYNFMCTQSNPLIKKVLDNIQAAKIELQNLTPEVYGSVLLLLAYFKEDKDALISEDDVIDANPRAFLTPYITTFGSSIYKSDKFAIVIDGQRFIHCTNYVSAFTCLFTAYYVYNIEYNTSTAHTMEYIQRCYADINPQRGTKAPKIANKKQYSCSPKVLKLVDLLKSFESDFNI